MVVLGPERGVKGCPLRGGRAALDAPLGSAKEAIQAIKVVLRSRQCWTGAG
jgi:hypothetical protein